MCLRITPSISIGRELRRGTRLIAVEPQVFDLLVYLVRNRERVVRRDDLIGAIWHGRIVCESTLNTRINAVRSAIADNGKSQRLVKTWLRKGVRFIGTANDIESHRVDAASIAVNRRSRRAKTDRIDEWARGGRRVNSLSVLTPIRPAA